MDYHNLHNIIFVPLFTMHHCTFLVKIMVQEITTYIYFVANTTGHVLAL